MDYKKSIESVLESLRNAGWERKDLEEELDYSENYITQQLSKGGNARLLKTLQKTLQKATSGELKKSPKQHTLKAETGTFTLSPRDAINVYQRMAEQSEQHARYMARQAEDHTRRVAEQAEMHAQRLENIIIAQLTNMDKKLDTISFNSNEILAGVQRQVVYADARSDVALEALARLEKKKPDVLKEAANKRAHVKMGSKTEHGMSDGAGK